MAVCGVDLPLYALQVLALLIIAYGSEQFGRHGRVTQCLTYEAIYSQNGSYIMLWVNTEGSIRFSFASLNG